MSEDPSYRLLLEQRDVLAHHTAVLEQHTKILESLAATAVEPQGDNELVAAIQRLQASLDAQTGAFMDLVSKLVPREPRMTPRKA